MLLHIHNDMTDSLDNKALLNEFIEAKYTIRSIFVVEEVEELNP